VEVYAQSTNYTSFYVALIVDSIISHCFLIPTLFRLLSPFLPPYKLQYQNVDSTSSAEMPLMTLNPKWNLGAYDLNTNSKKIVVIR
jgi:hypothetical protein